MMWYCVVMGLNQLSISAVQKGHKKEAHIASVQSEVSVTVVVVRELLPSLRNRLKPFFRKPQPQVLESLFVFYNT